MKRIGKTDQGGILLEMTAEDLNRFQQACDALADLLVQGANHGIVVDGPASMSVDSVSPVTVDGDGRKTFTASMTVNTNDGKSVVKKMKLCAARSEKPRKVKTAKVKEIKALKCLVCGRTFEPHRKDQTCCSVACRKKAPKDVKPRKNQTAKGTVSIGGCPSKKACELCGTMFVPKRKDSRLCSRACTDKDFRAKKLAKVKPVIAVAAVPAVKSPSPEADKKTRLEILRKIVKKDAYVPPSDYGSSRADYSGVEEFAQADREARRG